MLIELLVLIIVLALFFWVLSMIPMDDRLRQVLTVIIIVVVLLWLLTGSGLLVGHGRLLWH